MIQNHVTIAEWFPVHESDFALKVKSHSGVSIAADTTANGVSVVRMKAVLLWIE